MQSARAAAYVGASWLANEGEKVCWGGWFGFMVERGNGEASGCYSAAMDVFIDELL